MFCVGCSGWYGYYLERYLGLNIATISLFGRRYFLLGTPPPFYSEQECALYLTHARLSKSLIIKIPQDCLDCDSVVGSFFANIKVSEMKLQYC